MKKYNCSHITPSTCVPYEGNLPEWSKHKDSDECVMIIKPTKPPYFRRWMNWFD